MFCVQVTYVAVLAGGDFACLPCAARAIQGVAAAEEPVLMYHCCQLYDKLNTWLRNLPG
jgi:hypothetical protein